MGLITKEVILMPKGKAYAYYKNLGYKWEKGESITVLIQDLQPHSNIIIECQCDYCNKIFNQNFNIYNRAKDSIIPKIACSKCSAIKQSEVLMATYGVSNISQIPGITEKKFQTNYSKYGMLYVQTEECKQKIMETDIRKYGTPHHVLNEEVRQKQIATNILKFGTPNPFENSEIQEKSKRTKYKNGVVPTSRQQKYICDLYNMSLNYPIKKWNVDMVDLINKLAIEYDGGGHFLQIEFGSMTIEEFNQKERVREIMIKREGYKQIRIISCKDLLPSDEILLQMLSDAKQYFSDYPEHSWIKYDIDNGIVRNAENKDGIPYFYGELRKISESA